MAREFAALLGGVLLGAGLWGMFTGGHDHNLVVFGINATHNLLHMVSGLLGLVASFSGVRYAKLWCLSFAALYGTVAAAGFANVSAVVLALNLNRADDLLHAGIALLCLWVASTSRWE